MHFTEQTDQPRLYFENVGQAIILECKLLFRNKGKEEGEAAGRHCDNTSIMSMIVCFLFFRPLFVRFFFSFMGTTLISMEYLMTLPACILICLFHVHLFYDRSALVERKFKGRCSRQTPLSYDNKQ